MPSDTTDSDRTTQPGESDSSEPLDAVRARVATLCQRIKVSKDPDAIREVQEQLGRVGALLDRKRSRSRARGRGGGHG